LSTSQRDRPHHFECQADETWRRLGPESSEVCRCRAQTAVPSPAPGHQ
jgi:hypothetical protein